jgi:hypothetical protein
MPPANADELLFQGFRLEQLGQFSAALEHYKKAHQARPDMVGAATRYLRLLRDMRPDAVARIKLVWQMNPNENWETEWVRYLLSSLNCVEIIDKGHQEFHDGSIVVDNRIGPERRAYYFEMLQRGHRFALFHLSDEHYSDDTTVYQFANLVLRNYWSRAHASVPSVMGIPLGLMNGFRVGNRKPASERPHLWCFAGNLYKRSRAAMMAAMSDVEGGYVHRTNSPNPAIAATGEGAGPEAPLPIGDYAKLMSDSIFAPCPAGWENLDSFRVCEALEAGCIPIVERRPFFDYFRHLFGEHPMLTVTDWSEAPQMIDGLRNNAAALEAKRAACADWWQMYKQSLVVRVHDTVQHSVSMRVGEAASMRPDTA